MKISVCGKGGSGKSTVVTLLADEFVRRNFNVIVVDSDESNTTLYRMLNLEKMPVPLMEMVGGKKSIQRKLRQAIGLQFLKQNITIDEIPNEFIVRKGKINFVVIGKILQSHEGCACPMGALTKEFLKKINLRNNEILIDDMEAGIEHFGRGIEDEVDTLIVVVGPSYESIDIASRIKKLAKQSGINKIFPIINYTTIINENIREIIEKKIKDEYGLLFSIPYDEEILNSSFYEKFSSSEYTKNVISNIVDEILKI